MPKKSQKSLKELTKIFFQWAECRWEFQRRNEAYRLWWHQKRPSENLKYPDPDLSFELLVDALRNNSKIISEKLIKKGEIPEDSLDEVESQLFSSAIFQFSFPDAVKIDVNDDLSTLELKIDFKKINSLSPLTDMVGLIIRDHHRLLTQLNLLPSDKSQTYWKDYKRILIIGDLKRSGKKRKEIAEELAKNRLIPPSRWKNRPDSVIRSISDDWKKYKYLVDGGYKDITYP
jgi:hypothetical protein